MVQNEVVEQLNGKEKTGMLNMLVDLEMIHKGV
jgi:hypothetical protein